MGYDMRWRKVNPSETEAVAALNAEFRAACEVRDALPRAEAGVLSRAAIAAGVSIDSDDAYEGRTPRYRAAQDQVHAAYVAMYEAEKSYFRIGAFSMGAYVDLMLRLGMAFADDPHPPFPKPEECGTDWDAVDAVRYPESYPDITFTDSRLVAALKFSEEVNRVLAWHGRADTPGIPEHKFSSNDGWIVLPAECEAAVRIWQKFAEDESEEKASAVVAESLGEGRMETWAAWIAYLAGAARHDGFEVH